MFLIETRAQTMSKESPDTTITINQDIQVIPASPIPNLIHRTTDNELISSCSESEPEKVKVIHLW